MERIPSDRVDGSKLILDVEDPGVKHLTFIGHGHNVAIYDDIEERAEQIAAEEDELEADKYLAKRLAGTESDFWSYACIVFGDQETHWLTHGPSFVKPRIYLDLIRKVHKVASHRKASVANVIREKYQPSLLLLIREVDYPDGIEQFPEVTEMVDTLVDVFPDRNREELRATLWEIAQSAGREEYT